MALHFLQNNKIDKSRWDEAIRNCANGLIYAWSIYLDQLCPGWSALVNDDYTVLMPLTHKKKYGISYLYQPPFCQQLGVFTTGIITETIVEDCIVECRKHFSFGEIFLNSNNTFSVPTGVPLHNNYILRLDKTYPQIRNNYTNDLLKKNLQRTEKFNLQYLADSDVEMAVSTFKELYADRTSHVTDNGYNSFLSLAQSLYKTGNAFVRQVKMPNGELLACGLFFKDDKRIYNIASSTLPNGRTFEANHVLFDQLIQEFAQSGLVLDFEGSDLPGIERFYKKFGAVNEPYPFLKWNELPWPLRLLKK